MNDEEFKLFKKAVAKKHKTLIKHQFEFATLMATCTHNEVHEESSYFEGSYYDKAYTSYWTVCNVCGERSAVTRKDHHRYG